MGRVSSLSAALLAAAMTYAPAKSGELEMRARLRAFLDSGKWDATPRSFRIIALSFIADGCAEQGARDASKRDAALACIDRCLELARRTRKARPSLKRPIGEGLWLSHYNLILGARDRLAPVRTSSGARGDSPGARGVGDSRADASHLVVREERVSLAGRSNGDSGEPRAVRSRARDRPRRRAAAALARGDEAAGR